MVYPRETGKEDNGNVLQVVYDNRPAMKFDDFSIVRKRLQEEWSALPPTHDVISLELKKKIEAFKLSKKIANGSENGDGEI